MRAVSFVMDIFFFLHSSYFCFVIFSTSNIHIAHVFEITYDGCNTYEGLRVVGPTYAAISTQNPGGKIKTKKKQKCGYH